MMGHKICLCGKIWLIIPKLSLLPLLIWSTDICYCTVKQNCSSFVAPALGSLMRLEQLKLRSLVPAPLNMFTALQGIL